MGNKNKITLIFSIDVFLTAFAFIIPMIGYLNILFKGFLTSWSLILVYFVYLLVKYKKIPLRKGSIKIDFLFLIGFILVVFLNFVLVDFNSKSKQYFLIFFFFAILYVIDAIYEYDIRKRITIIFLIFIALGVQASISIPYILDSNLLSSRLMSSGQLSDELVKEAVKNGVGTNALYTSLGGLCLFGLVIQSYLQSSFARIIMFIAIFSMIFSIFISTYFASIFMFVLGVLLLLFFRFKKLFSFKAIVVGIVLFSMSIYIFNQYLSDTRLLDPILKKIEGFSKQGGDVTGRDKLANVSLETFYDNPFFGIGVPPWRSYDKIGEHMPWVDFLANFGLFGFLPLLIFLFIRIKNRFSHFRFKNSIDIACFIGVFLFIASNFISPMITTPITYISLIFIYTSNSFKNDFQ